MSSRLIAVVALVVFAASSAFAAAPPLPPANWTDGYVIANGIRIHYWRTGGDKPAMVLAHGSSDDGLCWTNFAKELERDYDIIMWDARGHGLSDPPKPADEPDVMVDDLAGLIRELKLVKPIVMGHSMGSATAAWFGAKYPDVARAIVLEDPGLVRRPPTPNAAPDVEKRRAGILARNNTSYEQLVSECMKSSPKWGASECEIWAPSKRRHHPDTALVSIGTRPPMRDLFPKIAVPVLILKADAQGDLRRENEEVAGMLKKGRIVHIEGAAHNVRRDEKQKALSVLKDFLASL
jgi:pimeloyl-ACP methyl ester carboxylesterase